MKIYEVVDELTERGQGADGAAELQRRRTDPMSPQNVLKRSQQAKQQPFHNFPHLLVVSTNLTNYLSSLNHLSLLIMG